MPNKVDEKWDIKFKIIKKSFELLFEALETNDEREMFATLYRNPIIFDCTRKISSELLNYKVPNPKNNPTTKDHIIGMTNEVLYIAINKLYEKWECAMDMINTFKSLNVLLIIPKSVHKKFKKWSFGCDNINDCIYWNKKLKDNGIDFLEDKNGKLIPVDDVYTEWLKEHEQFLN